VTNGHANMTAIATHELVLFGKIWQNLVKINLISGMCY